MSWPWQFLTLSKDERHLRRLALDRYAAYAQLSVLLPVAVAILYRFALWAIAKRRNGRYHAIPNSPTLKVQRLSPWGAWTTQMRKLKWWLAADVCLFGQRCGQRDQWLFGSLWTAWLLCLCVHGTGNDYLHLTKRFGIIAASQFPIQYLLGLKSLNPFAYVLRSSHEQINRLHRPLGRIIYMLLCLHATFYLNYFIGVGILSTRPFVADVFVGILAFSCLSLLQFTSMRSIRQWSYRIFFFTHVTIVMIMPPLLFFHARPARLLMVEALVAFIVDLISRRLDTVMSLATLETIPGTNLIKVSASIPYRKINRFRTLPGSHIYLSIPAAARPSSTPADLSYVLFEFLFNPFTVAAVDDQTGDLTLVARHRGGPLTSALAKFAGIGPPMNTMARSNIVSREEGKIPLGIEGPYGVVKHFPNLAGGQFSRVLLVAGGVGATFTVPLYRSIIRDNSNAKVQLIWALRGAGDATWALTSSEADRSLLDDENVQIFLTGDIVGSGSGVQTATVSPGGRSRAGHSEGEMSNGDVDGEVEMSAMYRDRKRGKFTAHHNRKRPDLRTIVDDTFMHGAEERIAVLVCGPDEMVSELREYVGAWVMKGRSVWWHNESFGW